ncbi:MAG: (2Fe-2S)-binding protein [Spirochaetia bacterium]|nr:(2Fe-2S)-binding protein [Spirochaetia bacterium]
MDGNGIIYTRPPKICLCKDVSRQDIENSIKNGNRTIKALIEDTKASTGCGTCLPEVEKILNEILNH